MLCKPHFASARVHSNIFEKIVLSSGVNLDRKLTALSSINQMLTIRLANLA
jgi:hypothetical protein